MRVSCFPRCSISQCITLAAVLAGLILLSAPSGVLQAEEPQQPAPRRGPGKGPGTPEEREARKAERAEKLKKIFKAKDTNGDGVLSLEEFTRPGKGRGHGPGMRRGRGPGMGPGHGPGMGPGHGHGMRHGRGHGMGPGKGRGHGPGMGPGRGPGMGRGKGPGTPEEIEARKAERAKKMEEIFKAKDADGDGVLSLEEFTRPGKGRGKGRGHGPGKGRGYGPGKGHGHGPGYGPGMGRGGHPIRHRPEQAGGPRVRPHWPRPLEGDWDSP